MKLQISLDLLPEDTILPLAQSVAPYADMIEVSTLLLYRNGISIIQQLRATLGNSVILADAQLCDRSEESIALFAQSGANWVTVMAGASNAFIHATTHKAHERGMKVMLDLIDASSPGQSALEAENLGVDALLIHQSYDTKEAFVFMDHWDMVRGNTNLPIFIATKINRENIDEIIQVQPAGIIIGSAITRADDPVTEAAFFKDLCSKN